MRILTTITGLREAARGLNAVHDGLPHTVSGGMNEAVKPIHRATAAYAPQRNSSHKRTGMYGKTQTSGVYWRGSDTYGYVYMPAKYAIWLRGTPDGSYLGAWMHRGWWRSLKSILDEHLPRAVAIIERRVQQLIRQAMG